MEKESWLKAMKSGGELAEVLAEVVQGGYLRTSDYDFLLNAQGIVEGTRSACNSSRPDAPNSELANEIGQEMEDLKQFELSTGILSKSDIMRAATLEFVRVRLEQLQGDNDHLMFRSEKLNTHWLENLIHERAPDRCKLGLREGDRLQRS